MHTSNRKVALLAVTVYSFFTCFIMVKYSITQNVFGWALSYDQLTYEWDIPNIHEGRKEVFNAALIHFCIFCLCVGLHLKLKASKQGGFKPIKSSESAFN